MYIYTLAEPVYRLGGSERTAHALKPGGIYSGFTSPDFSHDTYTKAMMLANTDGLDEAPRWQESSGSCRANSRT